LEEVAKVTSGNSAPQGDEYFAGGEASFIRTSDVGAVHLSDNFVGSADKVNAKAIAELRLELFPSGTILFPKSGASTFLNHRVVMGAPAYVSSHLACIICDESKALPKFVYHLLCRVDAREITPDQAYPSLRLSEIGAIQIPLPPLEMQREIVAEIEGYQKVINGARAVLDHYRPHIPIHPDWPIPTFAEAPFQIIDGDRGTNYPSKEDFSPTGHCLFLNTKNVRFDGFKFDELEFISVAKDNALRKGKLARGDVLLTTRGTIGNTGLYDDSVEFDHVRINSGMLIFRPDTAQLSSSYLFLFFQSENFRAQREAIVSGAAQPQLPIRNLNEAKIPLPPLATQQAIVAEIEAEQALVAANRELITRFERKIQATLARIWGEETPATPEA
jgi:type I restriction enzyme M protein